MAHWTIAQLPELAHLTARERAALLKRIGGGLMQARLIFCAIAFGGLLGLITLVAGDPGLQSIVMIPIACAAFLITAVGWYQFALLRIRAAMRFEIMNGLRGERVPVCLRCGYDLAGTDGKRCPECNAPVIVPGPHTQPANLRTNNEKPVGSSR